MKKLTIEELERIEECVASVLSRKQLGGASYNIVEEIPRLIADNKRLRLELNKISGRATKAIS